MLISSRTASPLDMYYLLYEFFIGTKQMTLVLWRRHGAAINRHEWQCVDALCWRLIGFEGGLWSDDDTPFTHDHTCIELDIVEVCKAPELSVCRYWRRYPLTRVWIRRRSMSRNYRIQKLGFGRSMILVWRIVAYMSRCSWNLQSAGTVAMAVLALLSVDMCTNARHSLLELIWSKRRSSVESRYVFNA